MGNRTPIEDRFRAKVQSGDRDDCWLWQGSTNHDGYGLFSGENVRNGRGYAHRFAYKLWVGPLVDGAEVDHICHNRGCVNPAHLRSTTRSQNLQNLSGPTARSRSGIRGVYYVKDRNKWLAQVTLNRKIVFSRRFDTREQAEVAVTEARLRFHTHNTLDRAAGA